MLLLSLAWGLISIGIWWVSQQVFRGTSQVPAMLTAAAFCLLLYRRATIAVGELASPRDASFRALTLAMLAVGIVVCYIDLRMPDFTMEEVTLPAAMQWIRPWDKHFRVLILAPVWGAWAMIIAPKFCKPCGGEAWTVAFASGCSPLGAALAMTLPLAGSLFYFQFLGWWQWIIPGATVLWAIGGGWLLCRLGVGVNRRTLLALNVLTQLIFLLAYLAGRNLQNISWY